MLLLAATVTMGWLWRFLRSVWEWADAIEEFQRTVNPAKFNNRKGYLNTDDNIRKFEGFSVHGFAYKTVRAPSETWRMRCGWLYLRYLRFWRPNRTIVLQQTLRLWVCIPEGVTESSQHDDVPVGVIINIHGGGMVRYRGPVSFQPLLTAADNGPSHGSSMDIDCEPRSGQVVRNDLRRIRT